MDVDVVSLATSLEKLKCTACKNNLSYFPVYISESEDNICGRCYASLSEKSSYIRNEAYENIAQWLRFPCRYQGQGCLERLLPANTPQHEKLCPFRIIKCPTSEFTDCTWEEALPNAYNHCQDKHCDIILKNGEFEFDLTQSHACNNLLEHNSLLFIIKRNYCSIKKGLAFSIRGIECEGNKKSFLGEINFKCINRNLIIQCSTTLYNEEEVIEILLDSLRDSCNDSFLVSAKISLEKVSEEVQLPKETINETLLSVLKCNACQMYALPPIYQNTENQVICSDCNAKNVAPAVVIFGYGNNSSTNNSIFGSASTSIKNSSFGSANTSTNNGIRNFNLDKIAGLLNYPCKYYKSGCDFISKPDIMGSHQLLCSYAIHHCPVAEYVTCNWSGFGKDMGNHVKEAHQNMILNNASEISENISNFIPSQQPSYTFTRNEPKSNSRLKFIKCYIIPFANQLFRLNFAEIKDCYFWELQYLGQMQETFMYELEIIDKANKNRGLMSRQHCAFPKKKDQLFTFKNVYCYFEKQQVESFISGGIIQFKVKIFK